MNTVLSTVRMKMLLSPTTPSGDARGAAEGPVDAKDVQLHVGGH